MKVNLFKALWNASLANKNNIVAKPYYLSFKAPVKEISWFRALWNAKFPPEMVPNRKYLIG